MKIMVDQKNRLLVHICCAPCAALPLKALASADYSVGGLWFGPNIHPAAEWELRRGSVELMSAQLGVKMLWEGEPKQEQWAQMSEKSKDERCQECYLIRLNETAKLAAKNGFDAFTTSLTISPYQDHDKIKAAAFAAAQIHGVDFIYRDFTSLYRDGIKYARENGWYVQKYCGCILSYYESDHKKKPLLYV